MPCDPSLTGCFSLHRFCCYYYILKDGSTNTDNVMSNSSSKPGKPSNSKYLIYYTVWLWRYFFIWQVYLFRQLYYYLHYLHLYINVFKWWLTNLTKLLLHQKVLCDVIKIKMCFTFLELSVTMTISNVFLQVYDISFLCHQLFPLMPIFWLISL